MKVIVKDDQGLGIALKMDGYSQSQIQQAMQYIRKLLVEAAQKVFVDILGKTLPETIEMNLLLDRKRIDEQEDVTTFTFAFFDSGMSRDNYIVFGIHEITAKIIIVDNETNILKGIFIHEMIHSADYFTLTKSYLHLDSVCEKFRVQKLNWIYHPDSQRILWELLMIFLKCRAEGIAILSEYFLTKRYFGNIDDSTKSFRDFFNEIITISRKWVAQEPDRKNLLDEKLIEEIYSFAPFVLLVVLNRKGLVEAELLPRALMSIYTGTFYLTEEESVRIIRHALSLSLSDYIAGVMKLGEKVISIRPFLEFCGELQGETNDDYIEAFSKFLNHGPSADLFNTVLGDIMGDVITDEEMDNCYRAFCENPPDETYYPNMGKRVEALLSVVKNEKDSARKRIAQWALTYLFDDEDVIYDSIPGLGYVDDMVVMDFALKILDISIQN
jgi:hypothetical protein